MKGVLEGVQHLHAHGIAHRDLKLENILLSDELSAASVKIADLGLAKKMYEHEYEGQLNLTHTICGSPLYLAPEIIRQQSSEPVPNGQNPVSCYGLEVDLWACGVILYYMLVGCPPFRTNKGLYDLFTQI
eukprot:scaffold574198_cov43-Prasinocladus_malaysianus.AAC.1